MIIYLVFKKGECVYVGQTTQLLCKRKGKHLSDARKGRGCVFGAAIRKHGESNFAFVEYINCSSQQELDVMEKNLIATLNPKYNLQIGGKSFFNPWNVGKKETRPEVIEKIKSSAKNRKRTKRGKYSKEHVEKMSQAALKLYEKPFRCDQTGQIFKNVKTAAEILNLNPRSLAVLLCGKTRLKTLKGFTFSYLAHDKPTLIDLETSMARRQGASESSLND